MSFNSVTFFVFLAIVFAAHWSAPARARNLVLVVASYVFYGWWDWRFLSLLAVSTLVDFVIGRQLHRRTDDRVRKRLLATSLVVNLGLLVTFKYFGFFVDSAVDALESLGVGASAPTLRIILPVGISFYTFQTISYSFDVYRRRVVPTDNLIDFATFVAYFPQLVAGPIERASRLLPLIERPEHRHPPDRDGWARALSLILTGLFKKVVLADGVATFVTQVFDSPDDYAAVSIVAAVVGFAIQLYGDFSGYSDIARGVSELFGIELMVNFRQPYLSRNITEFWRRWHISLSDWLREYVYIPFGGNRGSKLATYRNLLLTMLLGGAWHGASWNFVIWGLLHGVALAVHRFAFGGRVAEPRLAFRQVPSILLTFAVWCVSMVFFRAATLADAGDVFTGLGRLGTGTVAADGILTVTVLGAMLLALDLTERYRTLHPDATPADVAAPFRTGLVAGAMALAILVFSGGTPTPFIYFQF